MNYLKSPKLFCDHREYNKSKESGIFFPFCQTFIFQQNITITCWMLAEGFWHLAVWTWDHFKSLLWSIESYHYFFFPYMTRIQCYWSLLPEAIKPPAASFTVKCRRENWAFKLRWREGAPFFFFLQIFWREPKSVADGSRMRLRDNLGRAWKESQEAAALKWWAGLHWIKERRPLSICSSLLCLITKRCS